MKRDYYEVLGLPRDADLPQIKKAYRKLARELHPDVNCSDPACEDKFKEATEAYEVLCDSQKRSLYDAYGHDGLRRGAGGAGGFGGEGFGDFGDLFSNLFGQAFGGGSRSGAASRRDRRGGKTWPSTWSSRSKRPPSGWRENSRSKLKAPATPVRAWVPPTPLR